MDQSEERRGMNGTKGRDLSGPNEAVSRLGDISFDLFSII